LGVSSMEEAYSLRVPKRLGEKAIQLASKMCLFNKELKIEHEGEYLHIPLIRKPLPSEIEEARRTLKFFDVHIRNFKKRRRAPRRAFEAAAEKLPPHLLASFPRSIDIIGEVAVVEIPPELEKYKQIVGKSILESHKRVHTVLAKASAISGVKRLREYEVIAGLGETETIHREHGCIYRLDVRKVYFSPRLSYEHKRVASQVKEGETVIDMFAGVGPFSILIAKMHDEVKVYAIDINPDAVKYLKRNIVANRVSDKVIPILGDAGEIIRRSLKESADRVIMNLPEKALEYVEAACEAIRPKGGVLHFYSFEGGLNPVENAEERLRRAVTEAGRRLSNVLSARRVREVAPGRWQVVVDAAIN